jgi:hypothetical protein
MPMVNQINSSPMVNIQVSWQSLLWRLVLTGLLLLLLAGSGVTIFHNATSRPDAHVLPTLTVEGIER